MLNFSYKRSPYHDREEGDGGDITKITPPVMPLSATQTNKHEMNFLPILPVVLVDLKGKNSIALET